MQRKMALSISAVGFLALCLCTAAQAEPVPPAVQATYGKMIKAFTGRDFTTYATFFGPDYVLYYASGKPTTRAKYLAEVRTQLKTAKSASLEMTLKKATVRNTMVDVEFEATRIVVSHKMQAEMDAMPKDGPLVSNVPVYREVGVDTWKRVRNAWVKVKTVIKSVSAVM